MTVSIQKIKSNYVPIWISIIGAIVIISWIFLIVPDLKNDPSTFEEFFDTNLPSIPANLGLITFVKWLNNTDMINKIAKSS